MVVWVFAGGGDAEVAGLTPFLNQHFEACYFKLKSPVRYKEGPKPNQKAKKINNKRPKPNQELDSHGKTGKSLLLQIRKKLKLCFSLKESCDLILVIDDLDCKNAEIEKKNFLDEINKINGASGIEKLIAFASPELEAWIVADWDNTFGEHPDFRGCHKALQHQLSTYYNLDFKSPESFSQFDPEKQTCKDKLSEIIVNLTRSINGCKRPFSKGVDTPDLLKMITPETVETVADKCPLFREFYFTLKGLCRKENILRS